MLITDWETARFPAVSSTRTRSPVRRQKCSFLNCETLSMPALVRVSAANTTPRCRRTATASSGSLSFVVHEFRLLLEAGALMIFSAVFFGSRLEQLAMLAARHRVPASISDEPMSAEEWKKQFVKEG